MVCLLSNCTNELCCVKRGLNAFARSSDFHHPAQSAQVDMGQYLLFLSSQLLMSKTWSSQWHFRVCGCIRVCIRLDVFIFKFVCAVTSTSMNEFQNNLAQLFSLMSRCAI